MKTFHRAFQLAFLLIAFFCAASLNAQMENNKQVSFQKINHYTGTNAHSHNDYQQQHPFTTAYNAAFGSMEADIFLDHGSLYVGHTIKDVAMHKTLTALYLDSLLKHVSLNNGLPYASKTLSLQLLIDLKTEGVSTLAALVKVLEKYPAIIHSNKISIVITGNRPPVKDWPTYPAFILFDGNIGETYPPNILPKIAMISGDFAHFSQWNGNGQLPSKDSIIITAAISAVHAQGKKIRFWDAPDVASAWLQFMQLGVDWLNTDHIEALATYLLFRQSLQQ
jgi:alkaline phosphatase